MIEKQGVLFDQQFYQEVREKFNRLDIDPVSGNRRVYFDNAGGAF